MTVGLDPELAVAYLEQDDGSPGARALDEVVRTLGAELAPQSPHLQVEDVGRAADDAVWFTCRVDDPAGQELASRLLEVPGVRAAYVVPPEGPP